jgi:O-antigen/teichoic acid export membrane protein
MPSPDRPAASAQRLVFKNAAFLVAGQVLAAPLSVLVNAVIGRKLGSADLGYIYLATTLCSFGFLLVDFGQSTALPALIARDRGRAGALLGTGLAFRLGTAILVSLLLFAGCVLLGYSHDQRLTFAFVALAATLGALAAGCQDGIRGFERTDLAAAGQVGAQLLMVLLVVPALLLGFGLEGALLAQVLAAAAGLAGAIVFLRAAPLGRLSLGREPLRLLLGAGSPFLLLGASLALQPSVDAVLLARLSPPEVVGWHAVARKLIGPLMLPASALITSMYPTLSRLWETDREAWFKLGRGALRSATALAVPIALGCALYPDLGTRIFGRAGFAPAEQNLKVLAGFVFLAYFSMTLGCCLSAAGRQRGWAVSQLACVAISAALDPFLIPYFQSRLHNGGVGVCVAAVVSEVAMTLAAAVWLAPKGLLDRVFVRSLLAALAGGGAMCAAAWLLSTINPFVAAPLSLAAYLVVLWAFGGLDSGQVRALGGALARRWKGLSGS